MPLPTLICSNLQNWHMIEWAMVSLSLQMDLVIRGLLHLTSHNPLAGPVGSQSYPKTLIPETDAT